MKRRIAIGLVCLIALFFTVGCEGLQINISDEGKATLKEWAGFDLAYLAADEFPEIIEPGIKFCDVFLNEGDPATIQSLWEEAIDFLGKKFASDELLARNLYYASQLVTIQGGPALDPALIANYKAVVVGFRDGLVYIRDK
jgi:hypothetical protein